MWREKNDCRVKVTPTVFIFTSCNFILFVLFSFILLVRNPLPSVMHLLRLHIEVTGYGFHHFAGSNWVLKIVATHHSSDSSKRGISRASVISWMLIYEYKIMWEIMYIQFYAIWAWLYVKLPPARSNVRRSIRWFCCSPEKGSYSVQ